MTKRYIGETYGIPTFVQTKRQKERASIVRATLYDYYLYCKENGLEKGSIKRFAKERGILWE